MAADGSAALARVALWIAAGAGLWLASAGWRARSEPAPPGEALEGEARTFAPVYLRPALTLLALASVALRPAYPYGLHAAGRAHAGLGRRRRTSRSLAALARPAGFPPRASPHPGPGGRLPRELPRLRAAHAGVGVALGGPPRQRAEVPAPGRGRSASGLTFDAEGVSAAMEELSPRPLAEAVPRAAATLGRESWRMTAASARGDAGRDAIRATRITRQTIRGKEGGVYYVLAPGPSLLLAPALRLDRAVNRARGSRARRAERALSGARSPRCWSWPLPAVARRDRAAGPRGGARVRLRPGAALSLLLLPVLPGDGGGAASWPWPSARWPCGPTGLRRHPWLFGSLLATLPWLHQKFLPAVAGARGHGPRGRLDDEAASPRAAPIRLAPSRAAGSSSLYLTALYNFAITGSVRPDALFLAWGPAGVTTARRRPGRPRPAARRALRHPAVRAGAAAGGGRARRSAARGGSPSCLPAAASTT